MGKVKTFISSIPGYVGFLKEHWNKAPKNRYLTVKEYGAYCLGGMGAVGASVLLQYITLVGGLYMAAALNIDTGYIANISIITSVVTIITSPLLSWIIDNTNTKYGKFRPYLIILPVPSIILFIILGWLPKMITDIMAMLVVYTILFNILNFFIRIYSLCITSLAQVISPSPEERNSLLGFGQFCTSLGPSLVTMLYPMFANLFFSREVETSNIKILGVNTLEAIQYILPIFAIVFFGLGLVLAFFTKERMVLPRLQKQKINLIDATKKVVKNKYFWIYNIGAFFNSFKIVMTVLNIAIWVITYMMVPTMGKIGEFMQTIIVTLFGMLCIPGLLFGPVLINKYGIKKVTIASNLLIALFTFFVIFVRNPIVLLILLGLQNFANAVQVVGNPVTQAQFYDYQQYKTGDRFEGFLSQTGAIITTVGGLLSAYIAPVIYKHYGYFDNTDVLYSVDTVLIPIIRALSIIGLIAGILQVIPFLFYDLTQEKHHKIMSVLTVRKMVADGELTAEQGSELEAKIESGDKEALDFFLSTSGGHEAETADAGPVSSDISAAEEAVVSDAGLTMDEADTESHSDSDDEEN